MNVLSIYRISGKSMEASSLKLCRRKCEAGVYYHTGIPYKPEARAILSSVS